MTQSIFSTITLSAALVAATLTAAAAQDGKARWRPDSDGDGLLSKSEYVANATRRFTRLDLNGDGAIESSEIDLAATSAARKAEDRVRSGFGKADSNGDGRITREEIESGAVTRFVSLDLDGDGRLARDDLRPNAGAARQNSSAGPK